MHVLNWVVAEKCRNSNIDCVSSLQVNKKQKSAKKENNETDVSRAEEVHAEEEAAEEIK